MCTRDYFNRNFIITVTYDIYTHVCLIMCFGGKWHFYDITIFFYKKIKNYRNNANHVAGHSKT